VCRECRKSAQHWNRPRVLVNDKVAFPCPCDGYCLSRTHTTKMLTLSSHPSCCPYGRFATGFYRWVSPSYAPWFTWENKVPCYVISSSPHLGANIFPSTSFPYTCHTSKSKYLFCTIRIFGTWDVSTNLQQAEVWSKATDRWKPEILHKGHPNCTRRSCFLSSQSPTPLHSVNKTRPLQHEAIIKALSERLQLLPDGHKTEKKLVSSVVKSCVCSWYA
jgi:hypothetical protein